MGNPAKPPNLKKRIRAMRFTDEEWAALGTSAADSGYRGVARYLAALAEGQTPRTAVKDARALAVQIQRVGTNLNQLLRFLHTHQAQALTPKLAEEVRVVLRRLGDLTDRISDATSQ